VSSLKNLYQSPLETAKQYAVVVAGNINSTREKLTATPHDLKFMQVKASVPAYAICTAEDGCLSIQASNQGLAGTQVYFLPWSRGHIYRIRPKAGNTPGFNGNLLFTPNLDGCMITVEGTPQNPTVYHSNAANTRFTPQEQAIHNASRHDERSALLAENMIKIDKMHTNRTIFGAIPPKNPPLLVNPKKAAHLDLLEYAPQTPVQEYAPNARNNLRSYFDLTFGSVFGVRKNGEWTFYKQSYRVVIKKWREIDKGFLGLGEPREVLREHTTYSVSSIQQLWPEL
jgi:hypothetical protein